MLEAIKNRQHLSQVTEARDLVLVAFFKSNSTISMESINMLNQMKEANPDLLICSVDVGTIKDIHQTYQITSVPTVLVFRNGKPAEVIRGRQSLGYYTRLLSAFKTEPHTQSASVNQVTVYSTPACQYCSAVKSYLREKSVTFKEVDVAADTAAAQRLVAKTGQQGVPQIDINGKFIVGFNRPEIDRLLNL